MIAAFLNCLPQSALADSMVVTGRWKGCGSIDLSAALVLERAEKLREALRRADIFGNPAGILIVGLFG